MLCENLTTVEGRTLCVVFVKVVDPVRERVKLQCLRGRASVERGKLSVVHESGSVFTVPSNALPTLQPNDGTELLKDAEYYVLVHTDPNIHLFDEPFPDEDAE